jgi:hypothetical protein
VDVPGSLGSSYNPRQRVVRRSAVDGISHTKAELFGAQLQQRIPSHKYDTHTYIEIVVHIV